MVYANTIQGSRLVPYDSEIERAFRRKLNFNQATMENQIGMAEEHKPLRENGMPKVTDIQSSIARPAITAISFEIKSGTTHMIQNSVQFGRASNDDRNDHIISFLEIFDTFRFNGVSEDAVRLRLFSFTLKDKAKSWLHSLPPESITTWNNLVQKFLAKFFPQQKRQECETILSFRQFDSESLYEAWESYKDLLRKCPHHGLPLWLQVQTFYNNL